MSAAFTLLSALAAGIAIEARGWCIVVQTPKPIPEPLQRLLAQYETDLLGMLAHDMSNAPAKRPRKARQSAQKRNIKGSRLACDLHQSQGRTQRSQRVAVDRCVICGVRNRPRNALSLIGVGPRNQAWAHYECWVRNRATGGALTTTSPANSKSGKKAKST